MAKRKPGRPARFKTAKAMEKAVDAYFEDCNGQLLTDKNGNYVMDKNGFPIRIGARPPTITGLALALGFTSRQALLNYQEKEEFVDTVTRAKARVEQYAEEMLYAPGCANGAKFNLSNNFKGWQDAKKVDAEVTTAQKLEDLL